MTSDVVDRVSYLSGQWFPHPQLAVSVDDAGFLQGVTAVERLRTYAGRIFGIDHHLDRWQHSTDTLDIKGLPSAESTRGLLQQLLEKNEHLLEQDGDVGITMFATPGAGNDGPTFGMHLNRLDHDQIADHRRLGQPIVITDVRQPDPECWPRSIKVRSRIHYYLADRAARQHDDDAVGVLLDSDGSITETSVANLAVVSSGQIYSPPTDRVLGGITQSIVERLAADAGLSWTKQAISVAQFREAEEVLMMGTTGGIWFANSIDGDPAPAGVVYRELLESFDKLTLS